MTALIVALPRQLVDVPKNVHVPSKALLFASR
jgi:hypothetical protein